MVCECTPWNHRLPFGTSTQGPQGAAGESTVLLPAKTAVDTP